MKNKLNVSLRFIVNRLNCFRYYLDRMQPKFKWLCCTRYILQTAWIPTHQQVSEGPRTPPPLGYPRPHSGTHFAPLHEYTGTSACGLRNRKRQTVTLNTPSGTSIGDDGLPGFDVKFSNRMVEHRPRYRVWISVFFSVIFQLWYFVRCKINQDNYRD